MIRFHLGYWNFEAFFFGRGNVDSDGFVVLGIWGFFFFEFWFFFFWLRVSSASFLFGSLELWNFMFVVMLILILIFRELASVGFSWGYWNFEFFVAVVCLSCMNLVKWLACLIGVTGNFLFFVLLMLILVDHVKEI